MMPALLKRRSSRDEDAVNVAAAFLMLANDVRSSSRNVMRVVLSGGREALISAMVVSALDCVRAAR
jgi:hypothetical protein